MVRQEIRHGHFLAYCLDPQRPHGFGSECIRALLRSAAYAAPIDTALSASSNLSLLDVHMMDFDRTQIRREWHNIDLVVVVADEKLIVAIELKIDSSEHGSQLSRYRQQIIQRWPSHDGWRHLFLFLTKHGDEASEVDGDGWLPLPLDLFARELTSVSQRQAGTPDALRLLAAYLDMLKRHHLTDEKLEEIAVRLWSQHREALEFLMERRPNATFGLFNQIHEERDSIATKLSSASGLMIVPDDSSTSIIRFAVQAWDSLPEFCSAERWTTSRRLLLLEFQGSGDKRNLRMRFVLGPGKKETRSRYLNALRDGGAPTTKKQTITETYTRLATKSFAISDDDESDENSRFDRFIATAEGYARSTVVAYNTALSKLKP